MNTILVNLFHHHRWANERMFEVCLPLSDAQLGAEVTGTFGRLTRPSFTLPAQRAATSILIGWTPPDGYGLGEGVAFPGVPLLIERVRMTGDALVEVARELPAERVLAGEDTDPTFPAWVVLLQAAYHATEHRQQIATMPTHLGIEPPEPDLWAFNEARERGEVSIEPA